VNRQRRKAVALFFSEQPKLTANSNLTAMFAPFQAECERLKATKDFAGGGLLSRDEVYPLVKAAKFAMVRHGILNHTDTPDVLKKARAASPATIPLPTSPTRAPSCSP